MKGLKNNTKNLGSSNENKEHMDFSELEDGELNHEVIPSVTKRSRFFTDAVNVGYIFHKTSNTFYLHDGLCANDFILVRLKI